MLDVKEILKQLTAVSAPSGLEEKIIPVIRQLWAPYASELSTDRVGSLIALKRGNAPGARRRVLIATHMDEIGLMVSAIVGYPKGGQGHGFLRVTRVGGVDHRHLYGQQVTVHGSLDGGQELVGLIGALPAFMLPEEKRQKPYDYDALFVDVGLSEEQLRRRVAVGDFITPRQPLRSLLRGRVTAKALDNRASVAAATLCLEHLARRQHAWDVVLVATAQEETTLLGAFTTAFSQQPDVALAVDVTFGRGPGSTGGDTYALGSGPVLGLGANVHPGMFRALQETAKAIEMKVSIEPHSRSSGTDAIGLQISRQGIPTGLVGIPLRYMHTMVETVDSKDVERAGRLLAEFVARVDEPFMERLSSALMDEK